MHWSSLACPFPCVCRSGCERCARHAVPLAARCADRVIPPPSRHPPDAFGLTVTRGEFFWDVRDAWRHRCLTFRLARPKHAGLHQHHRCFGGQCTRRRPSCATLTTTRGRELYLTCSEHRRRHCSCEPLAAYRGLCSRAVPRRPPDALPSRLDKPQKRA